MSPRPPPDTGAPVRRFTGADLLSLLGCACFALFANGFTSLNPDLGWALMTGRRILQSGQVVALNVQSFTQPEHLDLRPDWLFDVALFWLHGAGGEAALIGAKWLLVVACVFTLWLATLTAPAGAAPRLLALVTCVGGEWLAFEALRAQLVSQVLLGLVISAAFAQRAWLKWAMVPLFALWSNLHNAFPIGLLALGTLLVAQHAQGQRRGSLRADAALLAACGAATLANPYGLRPWGAAFALSTSNQDVLVREWVPLWRVELLTFGERATLAALVAWVLLAVWLLPRKELGRWALLVIAVAASLSATRHTRIAPVLLAPSAVVMFQAGLERVRAGALAWVHGATCALLAATGVLWLLALRAELHFIEPRVPSPANAVAVILENDLHGDLWNDFDFGSLLLWATPKVRVAVDGRFVHAYSMEFLQKALRLGPGDAERVSASSATMALFSSNDPIVAALEPGFQRLFCDDDVCLMTRDPAHRALVAGALRVPVEPFEQVELYASPLGPQAALAQHHFVGAHP